VEIPRSFPITKDDLEKHGFSEKCPGCKAVLRNTARQGHSAECRSRLSKLMKSDDKVKEAHQKEMEFHEKVHEDMQKRLKEREEEVQLEAEKDEPTKRRRKEVPNGGHKRVREEQREKEQIEEEIENEEFPVREGDELFDSDEDLDIGWVEFEMEINGTEFVKSVNVEDFAADCEDPIMEAFDEITGLKLDIRKLRKARSEEIEYIQSHGIWEKVPETLCWEKMGTGPTSGKWVDVQKGDDVRSRYVGRDFKPRGEGPRSELFASMPPLEAKKILFSQAASQLKNERKKKLLFVDIKKAHMNAVCDVWSFVELPEEVREEGYCARLKYWLYGMRPAARAWEEEYAGKLEHEGYRQGRSVPTVFRHEEKNLSGAVHGDDFTFLGFEEDLLDLVELLKSWFELKVTGILGPDDKDDKEIVILGRTVKWHQGGISILADRKYADSIMKYCSINSDSKGLGGPGKKEESEDLIPEESENEEDVKLRITPSGEGDPEDEELGAKEGKNTEAWRLLRTI